MALHSVALYKWISCIIILDISMHSIQDLFKTFEVSRVLISTLSVWQTSPFLFYFLRSNKHTAAPFKLIQTDFGVKLELELSFDCFSVTWLLNIHLDWGIGNLFCFCWMELPCKISCNDNLLVLDSWYVIKSLHLWYG